LLRIAGVSASLMPLVARSQDDHRAHFEIGAQAIGVATREDPAIHGRDLTEGYLTQ